MPAPEFIGRYAVRRLLGVGGFAVVWLAHDDRLDDEVAIKVLADNFAKRLDLRDRFTQEARVLRRTTSQNLVEVFDIDELPDGRPYFVMTYADAGSLADLVEEQRLPVHEALRIGAEAARGVQDLHVAGVMHRDVKPSNILLRSATGTLRRILVADLGLSRELARGSRLTLSAGTPGYMAPEQADEDRTVDHRADIYGLGATVYFALVGQQPASDGTAPTPPSALRHDLPAGTDAVLLRALATDPAQRWPTAQAFADALLRLRGDADRDQTEVMPAVPPPITRPSPPARRRRTTLIAAAIVGMLALSATALAANWFDDPPAETAGSSQPTTNRSTGVSEPPSQPSTGDLPATVPSSAGTQLAPPTIDSSTTATPLEEDQPLPGTPSPCAVVNGQDRFECFLHIRGDTAYLLDFYSHDNQVVLWERKPDNDAYAWSQRWQFWWQPDANAYLVYNEHSNRCLTVDGQGQVGALMHVMPCTPDDPSQLWHWTDQTSWVLQSQHGTCLDVPRGEYGFGKALFAYDCNGRTNQQWELRPA